MNRDARSAWYARNRIRLAWAVLALVVIVCAVYVAASGSWPVFLTIIGRLLFFGGLVWSVHTLLERYMS